MHTEKCAVHERCVVVLLPVRLAVQMIHSFYHYRTDITLCRVTVTLLNTHKSLAHV